MPSERPSNEDVIPGNLIGEDGGPAHLALSPEFFWNSGQKLKVPFLNGSPKLQATVRAYAQEWERHANIDFVFVNDGDAEIRVAFNWKNRDPINWSHVGTGANKFVIDKNQPTMNLGSLDDYTREDELCRVILHEFGHALGCVHEHQSPAANFQWDEPVVIADAQKRYGWDEATTRAQILKKKINATAHTNFDPNSIMCYIIPPEWTKDKKGVNMNLALSETDISFIRKMYPFRTRNAGRLSVDPDIRLWYPTIALNSKIIVFDPPYPLPPRIVLGLTLLDEARTTNIRVRLHTPPASERDNKSFTLNMDSWAETDMYNAAATWLEFVQSEVEFEVGEFNTNDDRSWDKLPPVTDDNFRRDVHRFDFPRGKYTEPPGVVVWLNALDMSKDANWRIRAVARNVSAAGFDLAIESWADTVVYSASAAWVAYPRNHPGVLSGKVSSSDYRNWFPPQASNGARLKFDTPFDRPDPKVFIALSELDMDCSRNLPVSWHGDTWADSILYEVGADWVAFG
ncbi:hypothetical protein QBC46DRAFT_426512 [Diplogelasinospora grovesii]|uniref:Peptidase metallopeptidase domain-containing protein n=1 Tax=Diplogelasinospora grovesii TaxID=303347 RepID=A0AAN6MW97_9PEZI|nr:hypothetical protein QBC46DRAFT_426512 [Diplogelasinospora grovesii]